MIICDPEVVNGTEGDDRLEAECNDTLIGLGGDDTLVGDIGDELLDGGAGNDLLDGGSNSLPYGMPSGDTASYLTATAAVTVSLEVTNPQETGGAGTDTLTNIESLWGSRFGDTLSGNAGANELYGAAGSDRLKGGDGDDTLGGGDGNDSLYGGAGHNVLDGGAGNDLLDGGVDQASTASYEAAAAGVTVSLALAGAQNTVAAGIDTLIGIGNLVGSFYADHLTGDGGANVLNGNLGDDTLVGGGGDDSLHAGDGYYNDVLDGGAGDDLLTGGDLGLSTATYASATAGVVVSLALAGAQNTLSAGYDTLIAIGRLVGSAFDDVLTGSASFDQLAGEEGDDTLDGGDGEDDLDGGTGADSLDGGDGYDLLVGGAGADILTGRAKDDDLRGGAGDDTLLGGAGLDLLDGGLGDDRLDGGMDTDWASYLAAMTGVVVNLALSGAQNTIGAGTDTVTNIEHVEGSRFDDTLAGSAGANFLVGGRGHDRIGGSGGDDTLVGDGGDDSLSGGNGRDFFFAAGPEGVGNDVLDGGAGDDRASYDGANGVTVSLAITTEQVTGGAGRDTLRNIEHLTGSSYADRLTGNDAANQLVGGAGNDTLDGGTGDDVLNGGTEIDTATYASAPDGVTVSLAITTAQATGGAGTDILKGIEDLGGSNFGDRLTGNQTSNRLWGLEGDDTLSGGAGADTLEGGGGDDLLDGGTGSLRDDASYDSATAAVSVNLAITTAQATGGAGTDTLVNIENLTGSGFDDVLTGNDASNALLGRAGNDTLVGGDGADTLDGGAGTDVLEGGLGDDTYLVGNRNALVTEGANEGSDRIVSTLLRTTLPAQVENLTLGDGAVTGVGNGLANNLTGNTANNLLYGGGGNDTLYGGYPYDSEWNLASDSLYGGSGNDFLACGEGNCLLEGGPGDDVMDGYWFPELGTEARTVAAVDDWPFHGPAASYANATAAVTVDLSIFDPQATGGAGTDTLRSIGNLVGSAYSDVLTGYGVSGLAGNDTIVGLGSANFLDGGLGDDALDGGDGSDTLEGGVGDDVLNGGDDDVYGWDEASYANATAAVSVNLAITMAQATGGAGTDTLMNFENLRGSGFDDALTGDDGINRLNGLAGDDTLDGAGGGGWLAGGEGNDLVIGGEGVDRFVFDAPLDQSANVDRIDNFAVQDDTIWLVDSVFAAITTNRPDGHGTLAAGTFHKGAGAVTAHDASDRIVYDTSTGALYYDADGTGTTAAAVQFAVLGDKPDDLTYSDFYLEYASLL